MLQSELRVMNSRRGSDYDGALLRIPATDAIVWACLAFKTWLMRISKFREEVIKNRSWYIEKVTGNGVLLIAYRCLSFYNVCQRVAMYPGNRKSSKREVRQIDISSPNFDRTQTLDVFNSLRIIFMLCNSLMEKRAIYSFTLTLISRKRP